MTSQRTNTTSRWVPMAIGLAVVTTAGWGFSQIWSSSLRAETRDPLIARADRPTEANKVTISVEGSYRVIRGNGMPDHETAKYPNSGNPTSIAPQNYIF